MKNTRGALFMVLAMACFAIVDAFIKAMSGNIPSGQIIAMFGVGGALSFIGWFLVTRQPIWDHKFLNFRVLGRTGSEVFGTLCFVSALGLVPLTTASAVLQATPLVVAMGAVLFLGQPMGWRRWVAILFGFAGVLLIVRPGSEGFDVKVLLAVGGMLGLAVRDLLTRSLKVTLSGPQLALHAFTALVPTGLLLCVALGEDLVLPTANEAVLLVFAVVVGNLAYLAIVEATRDGNAGIISSFRYSRMVFALIIGFLFFAERPDAATLLGAAIIIASGLYTLWRETRTQAPFPSEGPAL